MSDDAEREARDVPEPDRTLEDDHELTFERGFGANEALREDDDRSLADIAGVSEEDVREDLLEGSDGEREVSSNETDDETRTGRQKE